MEIPILVQAPNVCNVGRVRPQTFSVWEKIIQVECSRNVSDILQALYKMILRKASVMLPVLRLQH